MNLLYIIPALCILAIVQVRYRRYQAERRAEEQRARNLIYFNGRGL